MIELNDNQIMKLKKCEINILKSFIFACESLNLKYYAVGGTLLGAVRHKGFIPWDDDIDIGMMRMDYEIFKKNANKYLSNSIFMQCYETDPDFPFSFIKLRAKDTLFVEKPTKDFNINKGVFIDIFPLDSYPENIIKRKYVNLIHGIFSKRINYELNLTNKNGLRNILKNKIILLLFSDYRMAVYKRDKFYKKLSNKTSKYVRNYSGAWGEREVVLYNYFGEGLKLQFEDIKIMAPIDYDSYLKCIYGDYMVLPPKEKRQPHHYVELFEI